VDGAKSEDVEEAVGQLVELQQVIDAILFSGRFS
jgi:hypothetical protein